MAASEKSKPEFSGVKKRLANWDLLRSLAMLFVVIVHARIFIGEGAVGNEGLYDHITLVVGAVFIICDPVFFMLSGYFALKPSDRSLKSYYLNKVSTIILPLVLYSVLFYIYMNRSALSEMSVSGYFSYFAECLAGGWWFIPTLIPCLVAAPFISKGIEHLSDKGVFWLGGVLMALSAWGLVMGFLGWAGAQLGVGILSSFSNMCLNLVPPGFLVGSMKYFQFFIMGGVFRRLAPHLRSSAGTAVIAVGLMFLVQDVMFVVLDIPQADPSYSWMFAAFGIMVLFDRVQIKAKIAERMINWTAKRSYSIYLIQYGTITLTVRIFSALSIYAAVGEMGVAAAMAVWVLLVVVAYLIALGIASICDTLLLVNLQKLFNRLVGGKSKGLQTGDATRT